MNGLQLAEDLIPNFYKYDYLDHDRSFISYDVALDEGAKIARITYHYEATRPTVTLDYLIVTLEEIVDSIKNGKEINLNYCYINDFYAPYLKKLCPGTTLTLKNFSAQYTFFDHGTDFSDIQFEDKFIDFNHTIFNGEATFKEAKFAGETTFKEAKFFGKATFSHAKFDKKTDFEYVTFAEEAYFNYTRFSEEVSFLNTNPSFA